MVYLLPPDEQNQKAIEQLYYYKDPETLEPDVDALAEWMSKQPHLPTITDRSWLKNFLIGRKNNLQRTKKCIESYFTIRAEIPDIFEDMDAHNSEWARKGKQIGRLSVLPRMTPNGNRVQVIRTVENTNGDFNAMAMVKGTIKTIDSVMRREPIYGYVFLLDLKYCQMSYLMSFTPTLTKNLMRCLDDALPLRIASVHYVNPPLYISRLVGFFRMFMPAKIQKRIIVHESYDTLYEYFPKDMLPDEYGGTAGSIEKFEAEIDKIEIEEDEWYRSMPKADLSRRPAKPKTVDLDMSGTFKKLDID